MRHWYPVYSHPYGPSPEPWYALTERFAFRTEAHPDGIGQLPDFRLAYDQAFPTRHLIGDDSTEPWYVTRGSLVYPTAAHPNGTSATPWYQVR